MVLLHSYIEHHYDEHHVPEISYVEAIVKRTVI